MAYMVYMRVPILRRGLSVQRRARRDRLGAGFTVVEVLAVLIVVGIVVGLAAPRIQPSRYRVEAATHTLGTTLLGAQRLALVRQHDVVIGLDEAANEIVFHEDTDNDGMQDVGESVRREPIGEGVVFGRGGAPARPMGAGPITFVKEKGGLPAVTFHRGGSVSEAGGFYLTSTRAAHSGAYPEETWALELERATGRPSWYRYGSSGWKRVF